MARIGVIKFRSILLFSAFDEWNWFSHFENLFMLSYLGLLTARGIVFHTQFFCILKIFLFIQFQITKRTQMKCFTRLKH